MDARSLPYRYDFEPDELDPVLACYEAHGFAIVRKMAPPDVVADLGEAVWDVLGRDALALGDNRTTPDFVEHSPKASRLLDAEAYVDLNRRMFGSDELTIHRSFAVLKNAGSPPVAWHRDYHHRDEADAQATEPDQFLDPGDHGFRALWYLDGSYPDRGGLWLIPDSHRDDWQPPEGYAFTEGRKSFYRIGEPPEDYERFDLREMLPLHVDPGDLVIYSLKLQHAAAAQPEGVRRACAVILRPTWPALEVPWQPLESSKRFVATIPDRHRSFVRNYVGIDYGWDPLGPTRPHHG